MKKVLAIGILGIIVLFFVFVLCLKTNRTDISFTENKEQVTFGIMKNYVYFSGDKIYTKTYCIDSKGEKEAFLKFQNAQAFAVNNEKLYYLDKDNTLTVSDTNSTPLFDVDDVKKFAFYKDKIIVLTSPSFDNYALSIYSQKGACEKNIGIGSIYDFCILETGKILYRDNNLKVFFEYDLFTDNLIDYPISTDKNMEYTFTKNKFICSENYVVFYEGFWDNNCIVLYNVSQQKYLVLLYDEETKYDIKAELLDDTLYYSCEAVDMKYSPIENNKNCGVWRVNLKTGEKNKLLNENVTEFLVVNDKMLGVLKSGKLKFLE